MQCVCGGSHAHHAVPGEECWCTVCLSRPFAERCKLFVGFAPPPRAATPDDNRVAIAFKAPPATSSQAASAALPKSGSIRRAVYDMIEASGHQGMTDDELERAMGKSHQTVSARRNGLMGDRLVCDSGLKRITRTKSPAVVWITMPNALELVQDSFDFASLAQRVAEPEADPVFDPRLVRVASTLAGSHGGDWRRYLTEARGIILELGLTPGADPV
jgi:hypothetical protein